MGIRKHKQSSMAVKESTKDLVRNVAEDYGKRLGFKVSLDDAIVASVSAYEELKKIKGIKEGNYEDGR